MLVTTESISERVRKLINEINEQREDANTEKMTYKELELLSGIGESTIKQFMSGKRNISKIDDLLRLANSLNVSPYYLLTGNHDENHVVCEDLGLASETIDTLRHENTHCPIPYMRKAIDALAAYPTAVLMLYEYLYQFDFPTMEGSDSEGRWNSLDRNDMDRIKRLRILDELEVCKVILKNKMKGSESK